jgi:transposase-like protein
MKSVHCTIYGHDYVLSKDVTEHVKEYTCKHCQYQVTTSSNGQLTILNDKRKEINDTLQRMYRVKKERKLAF